MKKKILIIEDEPDVAETIKMFLEKAGYSVDLTLDAKGAIAKLPNYDLLLLDLIMPKFSGRQVLREMSKKGITLPVVVLSAVGLPMTVGEEIKREFPGVHFVSKTEMYTALVPAIKSALKA
jgi:DNA-binding response OmpR family regulator